MTTCSRSSRPRPSESFSLLQRRGVLEEGNVDSLWEDEPLLATITAASVQGQIATGERAGQHVRRRLLDPEEGIRSGPLCFASRGFSLHAATRIEAPIAYDWRSCAGTSFAYPWPPAVCRSLMRTLSPSR